RRYRTNACQSCAIKRSCTSGNERRISRWEHEAVLETVQARLDRHPEKMTMRRQAYMDAHKATRLRKPCLQCHCHSFSFAGCGGLF
ncbi:MAG: hypothetical protein ABSA90_19780, partial [Xanthobacteraceae bacterium]